MYSFGILLENPGHVAIFFCLFVNCYLLLLLLLAFMFVCENDKEISCEKYDYTGRSSKITIRNKINVFQRFLVTYLSIIVTMKS